MKVGDLFRVKYEDHDRYRIDSLPVIQRAPSTGRWEFAFNDSITEGQYVSVEHGSVVMLVDFFDTYLETGVFLFEDQLVELDFESTEPV